MIKANYTVTLNDVKRVSAEAVKKVPFLKKQRLIFSLTFPFIFLLLPLLPQFSNGWGFVIVSIPIVMGYMFFHGYGRRMYNTVKATRYTHSPKIIPMSVELTEDGIAVEQEFIKEKFTSDSFLTSMETSRYYGLFLKKNKNALILIKKSPDNLSEDEKKLFNKKLQSFLKKRS